MGSAIRSIFSATSTTLPAWVSTYIVFTFSENDHRFYQGSVAECVRLTQERGLRACADPWGVGGMFGGEAFTERGAWDLEGQQWRSDGRPLPLLCPNSDAARTYLSRWIDTVADVLHADAIFWDEPHFYLPFGEARAQGLWACCCERCKERFTAALWRAVSRRGNTRRAACQAGRHCRPSR